MDAESSQNQTNPLPAFIVDGVKEWMDEFNYTLHDYN